MGRLLGFRGEAFGGGFRALVRGGSSCRGEGFGLSKLFYESKAPFKTNRFCKSNRFYTVRAQGSPFIEEVVLGATLRWRTLSETFFEPSLNRRFKNIRFDEISA